MNVAEGIEYLKDRTKFPDIEEPIFILRGRDPVAWETVHEWIALAKKNGVRLEKRTEAWTVANDLETYQPKQLPD